MKHLVRMMIAAFVLSLFTVGAACAATWQNVQLLKTSSQTYTKNARVWAAVTGDSATMTGATSI